MISKPDEKLPAVAAHQATFDRIREIAASDLPHALACISAELAAITADMGPDYVYADIDLVAGKIHFHASRAKAKSEAA